MEIDINDSSEDDLIRLNRRIVARLKLLESLHAHAEVLQFDVGQAVSFCPPGWPRQVGTLKKNNKKTVTVVTASGERWNVLPKLLYTVKDVKDRNSGKGNVIDLTSRR